ncbi:MAG TPA: DUF882 domain-containing protein [Xanthobacteraceae bacterium]
MPQRIAPIRCVNVGTPVLFGGARLDRFRRAAAPAFYSCGLALLVLLFGSRGLQNAIAEGDTRTISMHHMHTGEDITITFKRDGRYDEAALEKISWFLRDWRKEQQTRMDPHLIDLVWEVQRESGSKEPIWVVCGYRSPETNAMLRRHSNGVARFSQHILGHAMDFYIPGVPLDQLRAIGLRLQRGGVGFYPTSGSPFVHMDTGGIRHWPRMTREQLVRVFPDGRTVHIPTDGKPLAGYALALADIKKRGDSPSDASLDAARSAGFDVADEGVGHRIARPLAKLFGLAKTDEDDEGDAPGAAASTTEPQRSGAKAALAAAISRTGDKLAAEKKKLADAASRAEGKLAAGKAKLAQVASNAEDKLSAEKTKLIKIASKARVIARAEASTATPNQVIESRGFWQGLPDGEAIRSVAAAAAKSMAALAGKTPVNEIASADPEATESIPPFAARRDDRTAPEGVLAYAESPDDASAAAPAGAGAAGAATRSTVTGPLAVRAGADEMTIAVKRISGRPTSAILTVAKKTTSSILANTARLDDPWLRAVVWSPNVHRFLYITELGTRDFRSLSGLMVKPANSVLMTFAADPQSGLANDHFSGSAIVFISTITYPVRSAELQ